jgi:diacylglycerol kinase (ATP)
MILVISAGLYYEIERYEWLAIVVAFGMVIFAEMFNTAIEWAIDLVQPEYHPLAGKIKDVSAGAVLVSALMAIAIGVIVFWGYVSEDVFVYL